MKTNFLSAILIRVVASARSAGGNNSKSLLATLFVFVSNQGGFSNQVIPLPVAGLNFVTCQIMPTGGSASDINSAIFNSTAFVQVPATLSDPNGNDNVVLYNWNCSGYDVYQYWTGTDYDSFWGVSGSASGWYDSLGNLATGVYWSWGKGMIIERKAGTSGSLTLIGPSPTIPQPPATNICNCGVFNLLGLQGAGLGTYDTVTGSSPVDGSLVERWNGAGYDSYAYTVSGGWSPPLPPLNSGEAAFFLIPCVTNPCITMMCATNKTVPCGSNWDFDAPTNIVDNCCTNFSLNFSTVTNSGPCELLITRTWRATDPCGNSNACSQTVTVVFANTDPPVLTCAASKTVECGSAWSFDPPTFTDGCSSNYVVPTYSTETNASGGPCEMILTRTWQVTDPCGNTSTCSQTVTVHDTTPPVFTCTSSGVNLVPNPGFESYSSCPNNNENLGLAAPWFNPTIATPNFFHVCATMTMFSVPANFAGNQSPHGGEGYGGGWMLEPDIGGTYREYLETPLVSPLQAGHTYKVSFYVSLAEIQSEVAVDNLGVHFSTVQVNGATWAPLPFTPQVRNSAGSFLSSTANWMLIQGTYIAVGGENFLTLGNFYDNVNTPTVMVSGGGYLYSFYYVDDVTVEEDCVPCPTSKTVTCGSAWSFDEPTAIDACCGTNVTMTILGTVTNGVSPQIITRTWLATDCCTNSATCSQIVTVVPPVPPVLVITYSGGVIHLAFDTLPGVTYIVEYADSLPPPSWTTLSTVVGDGLNHVVDDPGPIVGNRFYRLRVICP